ncbi:hypothetical protein [Flavilitoribacter nigricans]|uniref:Uncharacterized protein n=1 Tax=Flavilitoribacter nigricans (strain ATCC 23147 / DSM 23189 / NBRC 102662 / NCIMB 1420 / SS-2) TaxID=1122177 RepID=A0A2D0N9C3_FLAN2|nr:hypothetical protein [Flavilitoribacter nigricans]PHN04970.1 hypothetical protein CRP01_18235 [Flavilitoribacter nigricans DSM 23189 = NBRC 102662]
MSKSSSLWTNPLTLVLIFLALAWVFAIAKYCANRTDVSNPGELATNLASPVPNYTLLTENNCPLKLSDQNETLATALLQQYFRLDSLNRFQEAIWTPNPQIDTLFARQFAGPWETYIECIQTLRTDSTGATENIALLASNFQDNDCRTCAPYIGYIRFRAQNADPATIVIRGSERALFKFGAYGAIGDQISLIDLGPSQALLFSTAYTRGGLTLDSTTIYDLDDFRPILQVERYESNGGEDTPYLYERKGELYQHPNQDPYLPTDLALYEYTTVLSGQPEEVAEPRTTYYRYLPDALQYVRMDNQ